MRAIPMILVTMLPALAAAQGTSQWKPIDLTRPGALEALKEANPARYERVSRVLAAFERSPCKPDELKVLEASFDVSDLACTFMLMTTFPAQRRVTFRLEDASYVAVVTMKDSPAKAIPAGSR